MGSERKKTKSKEERPAERNREWKHELLNPCPFFPLAVWIFIFPSSSLLSPSLIPSRAEPHVLVVHPVDLLRERLDHLPTHPQLLGKDAGALPKPRGHLRRPEPPKPLKRREAPLRRLDARGVPFVRGHAHEAAVGVQLAPEAREVEVRAEERGEVLLLWGLGL